MLETGPAESARHNWLRVALVAAGLGVVVAVVHAPVLRSGALWLDDDQYLTRNPLVRHPSLDSTLRFFGEVLHPSTVRGYYQPLAMMSLMLDYAAGGRPEHLEPFHRTNLLLHVASAVLVFGLLLRLFGSLWGAALVALLWGVHPLTVESLAWLAERKTLLATVFALGSLVLCVSAVQQGERGRRLRWGALVLFLLSLLAKPTTTPLPLLLVLLDWWPLRRLSRRTLLEKWPFFALSFVAAAVTYVSQARAAVAVLPNEGPPARLPLAIVHNIVFYLGKVVWPVELTSYYPYPEPLSLANPAVLTGAVGTVLLALVVVISLRWTRAVAVGALLFGAAIFPTLGVVGFTKMIASDKYMYWPLVALLLPLAAVWGRRHDPGLSPARASRAAGLWRRGVGVGLCAAALALGLVARAAHAPWRDTERLFTHMLALAPRAALLHNNYGAYLAVQGRLEDALAHYRTATALQPDYWRGRLNTALALRELRRYDEATAVLREMLAAHPDSAVTRTCLADTLLAAGRRDEALAEYAETVRRDPRCARALANWGAALSAAGDQAGAIARLQQAVDLDGDDAAAHFHLAVALCDTDQFAAAVPHYLAALRLDPANAVYHHTLALACIARGRNAEAEDCLRTAVGLDPQFSQARLDLGVLLAQQRRYPEALPLLHDAARQRPDDGNAQYMLGWALRSAGQTRAALAPLLQATRLQPEDVEFHVALADAYRAAGQQAQAVAAARRALDLARGTGDGDLVRAVEERLASLLAGQP
jgi:tetratricopeptide (TPR) repeat protein